MQLSRHDREDIKAALRKGFGSVFAFEIAHGLPTKSVSDVLRGRPNKRVSDAIRGFLSESSAGSALADKSDSSKAYNRKHFLNAEAK